MNQAKRKRLLLLVLALIGGMAAACAPKLQPEESCHFVQNGEKQRVSWKKNLPVEIYIHKSVPIEFRSSIYNAVTKWETRVGRRLFDIRGVNYSDSDAEKDGKSIIYWKDTWSDSRATEQARTTIYWKLDQISEADMKINAKDFTFYERIA